MAPGAPLRPPLHHRVAPGLDRRSRRPRPPPGAPSPAPPPPGRGRAGRRSRPGCGPGRGPPRRPRPRPRAGPPAPPASRPPPGPSAAASSTACSSSSGRRVALDPLQPPAPHPVLGHLRVGRHFEEQALRAGALQLHPAQPRAAAQPLDVLRLPVPGPASSRAAGRRQGGAGVRAHRPGARRGRRAAARPGRAGRRWPGRRSRPGRAGGAPSARRKGVWAPATVRARPGRAPPAARQGPQVVRRRPAGRRPAGEALQVGEGPQLRSARALRRAGCATSSATMRWRTPILDRLVRGRRSQPRSIRRPIGVDGAVERGQQAPWRVRAVLGLHQLQVALRRRVEAQAVRGPGRLGPFQGTGGASPLGRLQVGHHHPGGRLGQGQVAQRGVREGPAQGGRPRPGRAGPTGVTGRPPVSPSGAGKSAGSSTSAGSRRCSSAAAPSGSNSPARNSPAATSVQASPIRSASAGGHDGGEVRGPVLAQQARDRSPSPA